MTRVLLLGGTGEARELAAACQSMSQVLVVSSLAGRVARPRLPVGQVRVGGFGGVAGLVDYLRGADGSGPVAAVIDATHPFAAQISAHAAEACHTLGLPRLVLRRPGYPEPSGAGWHWVQTLPEAAALVPELGRRVLVTSGRQGLSAFAHITGCRFVIRCVDPPDGPLPADHEVLLARGPYDESAEYHLMVDHGIDVLVSKDSGGSMTVGKLRAAQQRGVSVVMVRRPALPASEVVLTVPEAVGWLSQLVADRS